KISPSRLNIISESAELKYRSYKACQRNNLIPVTNFVAENYRISKALENKIDPVLEKLSAVATHVEQVENRVTEAETRISAVEDTVSRDNADLNEVKKKLDAALEKIDDLENRSRRCNIRIIGLPEGEEGTNPVSFLRTWLPNLLNTDFKNHQVKIERAHRVPSRLPTSGERPRALMVKLPNFQDKARVLQAVRTASQLVYKRHNISIFEDFSAAIVRKRQAFGNVKKRLCERGIRFAMIYPATLRIGLQHNGGEKFFKHSGKAFKISPSRLNIISESAELKY
uniref:L1 transposable element RRM domain-containing protein n=1 Tax=Sinocyclocheilus grahami TaxID=75366 RepID=A0A672N7G4_SINGR